MVSHNSASVEFVLLVVVLPNMHFCTIAQLVFELFLVFYGVFLIMWILTPMLVKNSVTRMGGYCRCTGSLDHTTFGQLFILRFLVSLLVRIYET